MQVIVLDGTVLSFVLGGNAMPFLQQQQNQEAHCEGKPDQITEREFHRMKSRDRRTMLLASAWA
jgi:hypothetical protein